MKLNFLQNLFGKTKTDSSESAQPTLKTDEPTSDTKILLERAKKKLSSRNYESALADINKALEIEPIDFTALFERSKIKREMKDIIGADEDDEAALVFMKKKERGLK